MVYQFLKPLIPLIISVIVFVAVMSATYSVVKAIHDKGYNKANAEWQVKWDNQVNLLEKQRTDALIAAIEKENQFLIEQDRVKKDAQIVIQRMATDLANSNTSANGLRNQIARLAAGADKDCKSSSTAGGSKTARTAIDLCSELSTRLDERAGQLAEFADKSRNAGLACEAIYKIKNPH